MVRALLGEVPEGRRGHNSRLRTPPSANYRSRETATTLEKSVMGRLHETAERSGNNGQSPRDEVLTNSANSGWVSLRIS